MPLLLCLFSFLLASSLAFRMDRGTDYRRLAWFGAVRRTHRETEKGGGGLHLGKEEGVFLGSGQEQDGQRNTESPVAWRGATRNAPMASNNARLRE